MIYLIGGAPRVGKSIVAELVAKDRKVKVVSTDDLCARTMESMTAEDIRIKFPYPSFSGDASENKLSPKELVDLQITSAQSLEPVIDRLIAEGAKSRGSLVIEGVHLMPDHVRDLMTEHGSSAIRSVFLGSCDVARVVKGIQSNTSPKNWLKESDPEVIQQVANFVVAFSQRIQKEAERRQLSYQERTDDFEGDMRRICGQLLSDTEVRTLRR